ncbi:MAG: NUDIX hydrolase [Chthoniobacterales bacterium]
MKNPPESVKRWKRKSRKELVKDRWISLYADTCELPGGHLVEPFYVLEEKEWVHVVAIDVDGAILLTRLYRYPADWLGWELPCGGVDLGEEPLAAAKRELKEETGFIAAEWQQVGGALFANPARQTNRMYCFIARDLTKAGPQSLDVTEDIEYEFVSPSEVMNRIATGDFCHALHVACYLLAADAMGRGRAE